MRTVVECTTLAFGVVHRARKHWIFDLDGTLTKPIHDFDAIRRLIGVPSGRGILEWLEALSPPERAPLVTLLDGHELELAGRAEVADGASALLAMLRDAGCDLGILTRNNMKNVEVTLRAAGLETFFDVASIMTRDNARPKPDADGIHKLLDRWRGESSRAVMVGNHRHDLAAGRAAGVATVHVASDGVFEWPDLADERVVSLCELTAVA